MSESQQKLRLLFVDDEPEILTSLRLTLRKERKHWDMLFAESAEEALQFLESNSVDAIVTDMKMPGMNGAELLNRVRDLNPKICRVVISGYADEDLAMRALSIAHQFLGKPVTREQVVVAIDKTCRVMNLIERPELKVLIGDTTSLPAIPNLHVQLMSALRSSECSVDDIAKIVEQDPAMSAKFLQLANSAYFSLPRSVVKIKDAVAFIGFSAVRSIALSSEVLCGFPDLRNLHGMSITSFQQRATLASRIASKIALDCELDETIAATAGVVHGVGLLLLESRAAERCDEIWLQACDKDMTWPEAEYEVLGTTNALLGGALLESWGLPTPVVETVLHQNDPAAADSVGFGLSGALHVATYLANLAMDQHEASEHTLRRVLNFGYLNAVRVTDRLEEWNQYAASLTAQVVGDGETRAA